MVAPEKVAMKACSKSLIDTLAEDDIDSLADDLHSNNLLAKNVYEGLELATKTRKQKARDVVNNVAGKVNAKPKPNFVNFIKILIDNDQSDLAQMLEDKYVQEGGDRSSLRPDPQSNGGAVGSSGTAAVQGASGSSKAGASAVLTLNQLHEVYEAVLDASRKWYEIGMGLKVDINYLDNIRHEEHNNDDRLQKTLHKWLTSGKSQSWAVLKIVLESKSVDRPDVARTLPSD